MAMDNLQFTREDFQKKFNFKELPDDPKDVVELRKRHYYTRMMENVNQVLDERRNIRMCLHLISKINIFQMCHF
jgi:hypothetical protein